LQRTENEQHETSPIEFNRVTHTDKKGIMTEEAEDAYVIILYSSVLFVLNMQPNKFIIRFSNNDFNFTVDRNDA
jgi:hypothetical protein